MNDTAQKIMDAGAYLFAKHSFAAVSIRGIAKEAGANSALISYYFKGKKGLLKAIFARFLELLKLEVIKTFEESNTLEELCASSIKNQVSSARKNIDIYMVGYKEMNTLDPDLEDMKAEYRKYLVETIQCNMERYGVMVDSKRKAFWIIGDAMTGLAMSYFFLGGRPEDRDEEFFHEYEEVLTKLMISGLPDFFRH